MCMATCVTSSRCECIVRACLLQGASECLMLLTVLRDDFKTSVYGMAQRRSSLTSDAFYYKTMLCSINY